MGKETIAEFVGDKATIQALKQLGVHYAQGFAISKPQPFACFLSTISMSKEAC
ncbi:MAG: EAL domain-containing protein [Paraglaciecola sp.]|nr:EAL domain-containing protein [Paraglaciecola sp.]